ncbi:4Fe-4S binding protein [bacterium]|nr:4Fe-4S binding protein [bacterium]MBU1882569.1 4Fe-4S binding protein [bacterium]
MKKIKAIHIRRVVQLFFFLFFLALFIQARDPLSQIPPPDLLLQIDPLAAILTMVSCRTFITAFLPALVVIVLTFVLGRSFCGWVCPLGATLDFWNRLMPAGLKMRGQRQWKYVMLFGTLLLALFSIQAAWLMDPLVIFTRSLSLAIYPLAIWGVNGLINTGFEIGFLEDFAYSAWNFFQGWLLPIAPLHTTLLTVTLLIFVGILLLDQFGRRFWCRVLCPLGALLGLISNVSPFGRKVTPECPGCGTCSDNCRMAAIEEEHTRTRRSECILCMECAVNCTVAGTTFTWRYQKKGQEKFNFGRRRLMGTLGASVVLGAAWQTEFQPRANQQYLVRPPGAVEEDDFLDLCLRCEECVKACSSTGGCLQPSGTEFGWNGFWTPRARMRDGYCEFSCTLCGEVCPSGAIKALPVDLKQKKVIGLAVFEKSRCIPWEQNIECLVCEEHCPLPDKAIKFQLEEGREKLPFVDPLLCTGCGICETKCPVIGESAIRITSEKEQREVM